MKRGNSGTLPLIHFKTVNVSTLKADIQPKTIKPIQKAQEKLRDFVEDLNDHIKWLLNRKQFLLQGRHYQVLQQLNETKKALAVYEKGIRNLEKQIEDDPKIKTMKNQIKFYEEYSNILVTLCAGIEEEIREERQSIAENKRILADKKKMLSAKNHDNIRLASQITKLRDVLENVSKDNQGSLPIEYSKDGSQSLFPTAKNYQQSSILSSHQNEEDSEDKDSRSNPINIINREGEHHQSHSSEIQYNNEQRQSTQSNIYRDYIILKKNTEALVRRNNALRKNILFKVSNFNEAYELFLQAFHKYEDLLYKSQMVVHNQGLNGSLIFLLLNAKKKTIDSMNPVTIKDTKFLGRKNNMVKPFQKQQDGEVIDVIYSTFKKMLSHEEKKADKIKEMVSSVQYEQLVSFTPMQVMGLILLKPEVLRDIIFEFDEKKKRLVSLSASLKHVKVSDLK